MAYASKTGQSLAKTNAHGIDKQIWQKIDAKFDPVKAQAALEWILECTGETTDESFGPALKDGYLLCQLFLFIDPEIFAVKLKKRRFKPKKGQMAFKAREQIELFTRGCKKWGMKDTDTFTSQDLYEQENLNNVVNTLYSLNAKLAQMSSDGKYDGPLIKGGYAHAKEEKRTWTKEQLRKQANAIPFTSRGAIKVDKGPQLDGAGVVKTAGNENWKSSNVQSAWEKGSIAHDNSSKIDGAGVIKTTKEMRNWKPSTVQSAWEKGAIAHDDKTGIDSYGVIKTTKEMQNWKISEEPSQFTKGAIAHDLDNNYDGVGVVRQPQRRGKQ